MSRCCAATCTSWSRCWRTSTGVQDIALTTNGALLAGKARALAAAGLRRVTVSLDSLDDAVFMALNDARFPVAAVLGAIDAAAGAGLAPVKVNMVVRRGVNEQSILPMAAHFRHSGHVLRFIEYMDVGTTNGWRLDDVIPAAEVISLIGGQWPLEPVDPAYPGEVATRYSYRDGSGEIGVIASVTQPFCRGCTRARLSADGQLFTCLFAAAGHDLRGPLRAGATDHALREQISVIWTRRGDRYSEQRTRQTSRTKPRPKVEMSRIGG